MKIIFKIASLEESVKIIKELYYEEEKAALETKKYLFDYYQELKNIDKSLKNDEIDEKIYNIVKKEYDRLYSLMEEKLNHFTLVWERYNNNFINELSNYLNVSWDTFNIITGYISPVPVFPRYLEELSFYFHPNIDDEKFIETVAHECTHFLWFKKISKLYNKNYNDYTNEEWEYSELVVDPILNSEEIKNILNINEKAYPYFYKQKYKNEYIMDHINNIFKENITIEEKIIKGFNYYQEYLKSRTN